MAKFEIGDVIRHPYKTEPKQEFLITNIKGRLYFCIWVTHEDSKKIGTSNIMPIGRIDILARKIRNATKAERLLYGS